MRSSSSSPPSPPLCPSSLRIGGTALAQERPRLDLVVGATVTNGIDDDDCQSSGSAELLPSATNATSSSTGSTPTDDDTGNSNSDDAGTNITISSSNHDVSALQLQAQRLRAEAEDMKRRLEQQKVDQESKRMAKVDAWIERLLLVDLKMALEDDDTEDDDEDDSSSSSFSSSPSSPSSSIQLLKTQEQVLERLQADRYSQEQITAIFNRLMETLGPQSRSRCSPLVELLVDAVGKMDEMERSQNPNKRWSGKVERILRRRLFAMDWNIDLEDGDAVDGSPNDMNPWRWIEVLNNTETRKREMMGLKIP